MAAVTAGSQASCSAPEPSIAATITAKAQLHTRGRCSPIHASSCGKQRCAAAHLHPGVQQGLPAQLCWLQEHHAAAGDSCRGGCCQIADLRMPHATPTWG